MCCREFWGSSELRTADLMPNFSRNSFSLKPVSIAFTKRRACDTDFDRHQSRNTRLKQSSGKTILKSRPSLQNIVIEILNMLASKLEDAHRNQSRTMTPSINEGIIEKAIFADQIRTKQPERQHTQKERQ
jgi:hypothetical protein